MEQDLGTLTAKLFDLKTQKAELNTKIQDLNGAIKDVEMFLLDEMHKLDLIKHSSKKGTVYLARQVVPKVLDWDLFYKYIQDTNYFHMLERRASRKAFQEQYELGQHVPGVDAVVFEEVRTRKS